MKYGAPSPFLSMPLTYDRTLLKSLIASLAAHAFLLAEVSPFLPVRPEVRPKVLAVSIRSPAGEGPLSQARPLEGGSAVEPKTAQLKPSAQLLAAANRGGTGRVAPEALSPSMRIEAPTRDTAVHAGAAPGRRDVRPSGELVPHAQEEGVSAEALRQFRTSLAISAKRFKHYPELARERGWEGDVEIALDFRRLFPVPEVSIASSSGKDVLDEQAVEMIRQAARAIEVPDGLKGRNFRMRMPISFSLSDKR